MKIPFLDLGRAYEELADELDAAVFEVARSGAYVLGPNVAALEQELAGYLGVTRAITVGSGTDALHLALVGLGIGPGNEVITTPFTFAATIEAIEYVGAQPVLVDIEETSYNIDASLIEDAVTPETRAILPVHMFGGPANMPAIMEVARCFNLQVIEDCAQSFGAVSDGKPVGSIGNAGAYSFYPTKNMGCLGDGGLIGSNDDGVGDRLVELRNHGIGAGGEHVRLGFNSRLDELQAAILRIRLRRIEETNARRRQIAARYNEVLSGTGAITPIALDGTTHVYGYYTILVEDRDALRAQLGEAGIGTAIYYPKPLHKHAHFSATCRFDSLEVAERVAGACLTLPIFPELTDTEVDYVATTTAALLR